MSESTLLIVDDEPRNVKLLGAMLVADNYRLLEAFDGEQALHMARQHLPDVILLDVMMPGLDGFEVTRRLKADPLTQAIPIVLVTALEGSENRVKGLEVGADEFLSKPVRREELRTRVRAMSNLSRMHAELRTRADVARGLFEGYGDGQEKEAAVLLVEDDRQITELLRGTLQRAGYRVLHAATLAEARCVINTELPNLLVLDILLPDGDGADLLDAIKADPALPDIPALVVTAVNDMKKLIDCLERGADDYLVKPVDSSELVARARAALRRAHVQNQLKRNYARVKADSLTDFLTGAHSRRYLDADLLHRLAQMTRDTARPLLSVAMLDIDHFKQVNDRHGHAAGDRVLQDVVRLVQQGLRASDYVSRYGGEEFCLVLPDVDCQEAARITERLRSVVAATPFEALGGQSLTVSIGVAQWEGEVVPGTLVARADQALYEAKNGGRNRVCIYARSAVEVS